MEFKLNISTLLSIGAFLGTTVFGYIVKQHDKHEEDVKEKIKEIRDEQIRQSERIDRMYDKLINGKSHKGA